MSKQKSNLMAGVSSAVSSIVELPKEDETNSLIGDNLEVQPGDIVKVKQKDKTKSPYNTVIGFNHAAKQVNLIPFDAPGYGNRHERRARYAKEKGKV